MSDFPRGWTLTAQANAGASATITVPGVAGVAHVLDAFDAKLGGSTAQVCSIRISSSDGVYTSVPLGLIVTSAGSGDSASGSGLDLAAGPGASIQVGFDAVGGTGNVEQLVCQGHDI